MPESCQLYTQAGAEVETIICSEKTSSGQQEYFYYPSSQSHQVLQEKKQGHVLMAVSQSRVFLRMGLILYTTVNNKCGYW